MKKLTRKKIKREQNMKALTFINLDLINILVYCYGMFTLEYQKQIIGS